MKKTKPDLVGITMHNPAPNHRTRNVRVKAGTRQCHLITLSDQGPPIEVGIPARLRVTSFADTITMRFLYLNEA